MVSAVQLSRGSEVAAASNIQSLSPVQHFKQLSEAFERALSEKGETKSNYRTGRKIPIGDDVFLIHTNALTNVGVGVVTGGGVISVVAKELLSKPSAIERSPMTGQWSQTAKVGATASCIGLTFTITAYHLRARSFRTDILEAFKNIARNEVPHEHLLQSANGITEKIEQSWFSRIFQYYNPIPIGYLQLIKGIALDSKGLHAEAQKRYDAVLQKEIDEGLKTRAHFAFACSLRLAKQAENSIAFHANQIAGHSPFHALGQLILSYDEIFNEENIPTTFICPITCDVMVQPTFYTIDGVRHYCEYSAIKRWIESGGTCPLTRRAIRVAQLTLDPDLALQIQMWNQIKLKRS